MKNNILIILVFGLLIVSGFLLLRTSEKPLVEQACTQEAMVCPDGSTVGRTGPNCEFAPCPERDPDDWMSYTDMARAIRFQYPAKLDATYIFATDWPPKVDVSSQSYSCDEPILVNGMSYCLGTKTEGAAGSVYTEYSYSFPKEDQTVTLTFALQYVQCGTYDEAEMQACEVERGLFDPHMLADQIAQTVVFIGT